MVINLLNLTLGEILSAVEGKLIFQASNKLPISGVSTDTRTLSKDSLFIAIKGENHNGNLFVEDALKREAAVCIVDEVYDNINYLYNKNIIKVDNTREALLKLAAYYRKKLNIKVVGVTGSTGKTSTKDIIAAILSSKFKVYKTKGNYNNEIGMPLTILNMQQGIDIAVLEMGMSNLNEIHKLAETSLPDLAVITNIGITHIENLKTRENIFKAKMEITDFFKASNVLIVNGEDDLLKTIGETPYKVVKTGFASQNNIIGKDIKNLEHGMKFNVIINSKEDEFFIPLIGKHNVENTLLAIGVGESLGLSIEDMQRGISNIESTSMRLEIVEKNGVVIINDCYNASPTSMKAAIDVEKSLNVQRRIAVLGTMKELGDYAPKSHREIGKYAKENKIDVLITLGEYSSLYKEGYGEDIIICNSIEEIIERINDMVKLQDSILIKASRSEKFERIVHGLLEQLN